MWAAIVAASVLLVAFISAFVDGRRRAKHEGEMEKTIESQAQEIAGLKQEIKDLTAPRLDVPRVGRVLEEANRRDLEDAAASD